MERGRTLWIGIAYPDCVSSSSRIRGGELLLFASGGSTLPFRGNDLIGVGLLRGAGLSRLFLRGTGSFVSRGEASKRSGSGIFPGHRPDRRAAGGGRTSQGGGFPDTSPETTAAVRIGP